MPSPNLSTGHHPQVHGHRGCRGLFPENTLPAFLHAVALGVDVLEMDVVISQDHQVVVAHDHWLSARLGLGPAGEAIDPYTEKQLRLYGMPYAKIRRCALGVFPHPHYPRQQAVPTYRPLLREVLQATTQACQQLGRSLVNYSVELKSSAASDGWLHPDPSAFVGLILAELSQAGVANRSTLLSFDSRILQVAHQTAPQQALCFLLEETPRLPDLFSQLGFIPDVFGPAHWLVTPELLWHLRSCYPSVQLVPWTVNSRAEMLTALEWQVDGITTDYPDYLLGLLAAIT